jgi:hypothetical protein
MDLHDYFERFSEALEARYGDTFKDGFRRIEERFREVRSGDRSLSVADVMAIFASDLPFCQDWAKPDREALEARMTAQGISERIRRLAGASDSKKLIAEIWRGFQDLSLTSLVLHHVYPDRFAMCSHNIASLLQISAPGVPEFYGEYCAELKAWGQWKWPRTFATRHRPKLTVVQTEFALWTWYRLAYIQGSDLEREKHRANFQKDPWIQGRRAERILRALGRVEKLDLARFYLSTQPTVSAMVAWRQLEVTMREILHRSGEQTTMDDNFHILLAKLPNGAFSPNLRREDLRNIWYRRKYVIHNGEEMGKDEASRLLKVVDEFIDRNVHDSDTPPQSFAHAAR